MSHFCVLVITDQEPTDEILTKALQPYHEYECTGIEDEYVRDVDVTDEVLKAWESDDHDAEDMEAWATEYGGWFKRGERWYSRTNPDAKWDYWTVGGRYAGAFKPGDTIQVSEFRRVRGALLDARKSQLASVWDLCRAKYAREPFKGKTFEEARRAWIDLVAEARKSEGMSPWKAVDALPDGKELRSAASHYWEGLPDDVATREDFIATATPISAFAILKDGKWMEKGEMGWFAIVSNEKEDGEWKQTITEVIDGLPDSAWMTIVDCHI